MEQGRDGDLQELVSNLVDAETDDKPHRGEPAEPDDTPADDKPAEQGKADTAPEPPQDDAPPKADTGFDKGLQKVQQEMGNLRRQMEELAKAKAAVPAAEPQGDDDVDPYKMTPQLARQLKELDAKYDAQLKAYSAKISELESDITARRVREFRQTWEADEQNAGVTFDEVEAAVEKELSPYKGDTVPRDVWAKLVRTTWDQQAQALRLKKAAEASKPAEPKKKSPQGAKVVSRPSAVSTAPDDDDKSIVVEDRFVQGLLGDD